MRYTRLPRGWLPIIPLHTANSPRHIDHPDTNTNTNTNINTNTNANTNINTKANTNKNTKTNTDANAPHGQLSSSHRSSWYTDEDYCDCRGEERNGGVDKDVQMVPTMTMIMTLPWYHGKHQSLQKQMGSQVGSSTWEFMLVMFVGNLIRRELGHWDRHKDGLKKTMLKMSWRNLIPRVHNVSIGN